ELVADVRVVAAGPGRVDELAAAERCPGIDEDEDGRRRLPAREQLVGEFWEIPPERRPVAPGVDLTGQALDHVDARIAAVRFVVVARRHVDPERPDVRVAERVALQNLALEGVLVEAPREVVRPRLHAKAPLAVPSSGRPGLTRAAV